MNDNHTSRRRFVQLAAGTALALRHGLLPAKTPGPGSTVVASFGDAAIQIDWDEKFHTRISRRTSGGVAPLSAWSASDYLLRADGRHLTDFSAVTRGPIEAIADVHGAGKRLRVQGRSVEGIEKTVSVTLYERYPGFALMRVAYRNGSAQTLTLKGWTSHDFSLPGLPGAAPHFWSYSGATYEDRRDWVQPVTAGFSQDNFLGMEASDYGGGTPIVDVWRRDGGLAVGHVELSPRLVSLPVQEEAGRVRLALSARDKQELKSGETLDTLESFVAVHQRDHFATVNTYRLIMADKGLKAASPNAGSYEPIWCAWGYERNCTTALIVDTLPKVKELGLKWAVIDDGWQAAIGDWRPHPVKYPNGEKDLNDLVSSIRAHDLKPRLWYSPLSVAPGTDQLHDHADMLLLDKEGGVQKISWWNSFYLCPAYAKTVDYTRSLIKTFIGQWGFEGLKIDGQHLNGVAPCYNPAHHHARPEESVEGLQNFYKAIYEAALEANPAAVVEVCPCGTSYSAFNFPYMNQAPASDPENSWQVRLKGKTLKGLMGPQAPFAGDHVELSDNQNDFPTHLGMGAVISTKFTWPVDPKPKDSFLLTPTHEALWRKSIALYGEKMLPTGNYRGELYDIGFDEPETHTIEKSGRLYYAMYAERFEGEVALRGLPAGSYEIRDYWNGRSLGTVTGPQKKLAVNFEHFLLIEAIPA
jgi:alpha-galactosidase